MLDKQFISRLPTERLLNMLGSRQARLDAWLEMDAENRAGGEPGFDPFSREAVIGCTAQTLGERLRELEARLGAIERKVTGR